MRIPVACEESQEVAQAFRLQGHEAWSCDLLQSAKGLPYHIQGDVLEVIRWGCWDMMIAHPPCTRLCNSGVSWFEKRNLWEEMKQGALFFKEILEANIPLKAIENPIPHKYALEIIGKKYNQIIQPWMFGHGETKLEPIFVVEGRIFA